MLELPVTFRPQAQEDLGRLFDRILTISRDVDTAEDYVRRVRDKCVRIGFLPFGGRARDDLEPGPRSTSFRRSVVIACRVEPNCVEIVNLFGRGRDCETFYKSAVPPRS